MEEKQIMLSIVIPCYNAQDYIELAVKNLEKQTFKEWEAIFVNDGSNDATGQLLDTYACGRKNFIVLHKENGGAASARNRGLEAASGKYITFLDADDETAPEMYEKLVRMMESTRADMGICGFYFKVEKESKGNKQTAYLEEKSYPGSFYQSREEIRARLVDMWDSDLLSNVWNKLYRMDLVREKGLRYRDGHVYTEDRVFNRLFIENCSSIAVTDECLYYYVRERTGSTTEKYRDDYFQIRNKEYLEFQEHFKRMGVWDEKAREYVSREFIERISGCLENIFHAEDRLSEKEKKALIKKYISHPDVREALRHARYRSRKMKLLAAPIKSKSVTMAYLLYRTVYLIRRKDPALFHKLKGQR